MKPFETLDTFTTLAGQRLTLHHRDGDYYIDLDGHELMSTRVHDSETALGRLGCERLRRAQQPRVLIGGLGLGYTLKAALEALPGDADVVQVELFPVVIEWHRRYLQGLGVPLEDARVRIEIGDIVQVIAGHEGEPWDAILIDTDNGPDAMCIGGNLSLYDDTGIELIRAALRRGGTLAVWSAHADPAYVRRLRSAGFRVREETVHGHRGKGPRHTIFLAER